MTVPLVSLQLRVVSSQLEGETFPYAAAAQNRAGAAARSQRHLLARRQDAPRRGSWLTRTMRPGPAHTHDPQPGARSQTSLDSSCSPVLVGAWATGLRGGATPTSLLQVELCSPKGRLKF